MTKPVERPDVAVHGKHFRGVHVHVEGIKPVSGYVISVGLGKSVAVINMLLQGEDILLTVSVVLLYANHGFLVAGTAQSM